MKAIAILPAAAAAMLAFGISMASSQDVCIREFQACMDSCGSKPSKSMQDTCFSGCETKNDMCSERVFGARGGASTVLSTQPVAPAAPAKDAMAKKEPRGRDQKRVQKQAPAPAAEQQEQAPAVEQEQAPPAR
jgi:hypothetical protein